MPASAAAVTANADAAYKAAVAAAAAVEPKTISSGSPARNDSIVVTETISALLTLSEQDTDHTPPGYDVGRHESSSKEAHGVFTDRPAKPSVKVDSALVMVDAAQHDAESGVIDNVLEELVNAAGPVETVHELSQQSTPVHEAVADVDSSKGRHSIDAKNKNIRNQKQATQPFRLTADIDDAVADLSSSAMAAAADGAAHSSSIVSNAAELQLQQLTWQLPQSSQPATATEATLPSGIKSGSGAMLSLNAEMAGLAPAEDREPAVHAMLSLDQEMAGLTPDADVTETAAMSVSSIPHDAGSASQITSQQSVGVDSASVMDRLMAEVDTVQQSDSFSAGTSDSMLHSVLSTAGNAMLSLDQEMAGLIQEADAPVAEHSSTAAVPNAVAVSEGRAVAVSEPREWGSVGTGRPTADADEAVADLIRSTIGGELMQAVDAIETPAAGKIMSGDSGCLTVPLTESARGVSYCLNDHYA